MSPPATLKTICIETTCGLLMSGVWEELEQNPFSCMPISVVQELLSCMWPKESALSRVRITQSYLLLTSCRLEQVDLPRVEDEKDCVRLLRMLSGGCRNLRTLSVIWDVDEWKERDVSYLNVRRAFRELLPDCAKLENIHSSICFDPILLENCRNLKTLRLHFNRAYSISQFFRGTTSDLLKNLRSIEVFAVCLRLFSKDIYERFVTPAIVRILDNCPQLTSLGFLDSSAALEELHDRDLKTLGIPRQLQMRRCWWNYESTHASPQSVHYNNVRVAALSSPLLEVLVINVYYASVLRHLKTLKNLTCLIISVFLDTIDDEQELYSLLEEIGPKLRHLTVGVYGRKPLSVNIVCGSCPNLITLELEGEVTVEEGGQPCASLLHLERLKVGRPHRKGVLYLLSNCLHLKVLCLRDSQEFGDSALRKILRKNPFAELEAAFIDHSSLSESGWRSFLRSAVKLTKCFLPTELLDDDGVMQCIRYLNPSVVCHPDKDFFEHREVHFIVLCPCWL